MKNASLKKMFAGALLLAAAALAAGCAKKSETAETVPESQIYTVARGDLEVTITGSGRLEAADTLDVKVPSGIEVESVPVEAGDEVKAGDLIAVFDADSVEKRASELSSELAQLDRTIAFRGDEVTTVKAPVRGRLKYIYARVGDDVIDAVNRYGSLCLINTDDLMQVEIETAAAPVAGTEVEVRFDGGKETGTVVSLTGTGCVITLPDKKAPYLGTAEVYLDGRLLGTGTLELHAPVEVYGNGGTIKTVTHRVDDTIMASATLFTLENAPASDSYRLNLAERSEKAAQLTKVLALRTCPNVLAPADGVITEVSLKEGEETDSADGDDVKAFVLATGGATKLVVEVDELDIGKVYTGQPATVTLDAYENELFSATVKRVSRVGKLSGSITVYETELELAYDARLLDGMNGSAEILSDKAENAVLVPVGALHEDSEGIYVNKIGADGTASRQAVTTGLANANYAEVLSGLSEGDRIEYKASTGALMMSAMQEQREEMMAAYGA